MSVPSQLPTKSPLHDSALSLAEDSDNLMGQEVAIFSVAFGVMIVATVTSISPDGWVGLENDVSSYGWAAADMGLEPYEGGTWNESVFTVLSSSRHKLPAPTINREPGTGDGFDEEEGEEY